MERRLMIWYPVELKREYWRRDSAPELAVLLDKGANAFLRLGSHSLYDMERGPAPNRELGE